MKLLQLQEKVVSLRPYTKYEIMLGVKSMNEPITGKYAEKLMMDVIEMFVNPQKVDKESLHFNFDWSEIDKGE